MSELLISSLMAEGSLDSALATAIEFETKEYAGENGKEKVSESKDAILMVPLLHLTQQLLRTSASQVLNDLRELARKPPALQWPYIPPPRSMTVELLLKVQRLLIGSFFVSEEEEKPWYLCRGKERF